MSFTDTDLYRRIKEGDQEAFEFIFLKYYNDLCIYANGIIHHKLEAEEIVQGTFVKLWMNRQNLVIDISINAYLYRSIHNQCINFLQKRTIREKYSYSISRDYDYLIFPLSDDYPEAYLQTREVEAIVETAINSLPKQCRKIFEMSRFDDLSYREIAEKLNISINTVKKQITRAISRLRELLKEYLPIVFLFTYLFSRIFLY